MTEVVERVELWHRSEPAPHAREALADLTDRVERAASAAYARFRRWAVREGIDLGPSFERETWRNEFSGEVGERVVLPVACLA